MGFSAALRETGRCVRLPMRVWAAALVSHNNSSCVGILSEDPLSTFLPLKVLRGSRSCLRNNVPVESAAPEEPR